MTDYAPDLLAPLLARLGYVVSTWGVCPAIDADLRDLAIAILHHEADERLTPPERACLLNALRAAVEGDHLRRHGVTTYFPGFAPAEVT